MKTKFDDFGGRHGIINPWINVKLGLLLTKFILDSIQGLITQIHWFIMIYWYDYSEYFSDQLFRRMHLVGYNYYRR